LERNGIVHSKTFKSRLWKGLVLLGAVAAAGCGSGRNSAPVSGRVTINGKPEEGIVVYFAPSLASGGDAMDIGVSSYGRTDDDGRYTLSFMDIDKDRPGALVTTHHVRMDDSRTFDNPAAISRVPPGWEATFEVTEEGTDKADFDVRKR
jgi:hypothetical protein